MQGVPKTLATRTVVGYRLPATIQGQPSPPPKQGSNFYDNETYPLPVAAQGPDWGIGPGYSAISEWVPSVLEEEYYHLSPANYGIEGSGQRPAWQGVLTNPDEAGANEFATNKVRTIRWQGQALASFDPSLPQWNVLPPGAYYRSHVPSVKQNRTFASVTTKQSLAGPLDFNSPAVASLVQSGLSGS